LALQQQQHLLQQVAAASLRWWLLPQQLLLQAPMATAAHPSAWLQTWLQPLLQTRCCQHHLHQVPQTHPFLLLLLLGAHLKLLLHFAGHQTLVCLQHLLLLLLLLEQHHQLPH
jgi:hypothetical protein